MTTAQTEARAVDTAVVEAIHALRLEQPGRAYDILVAAIEATLAARDAELAALKKEAADVVRPFAKAGELFPEPQFDFEQCIYNPAAGPEYALGSSHLRAARSFLDKWEGRDG